MWVTICIGVDVIVKLIECFLSTGPEYIQANPGGGFRQTTHGQLRAAHVSLRKGHRNYSEEYISSELCHDLWGKEREYFECGLDLI